MSHYHRSVWDSLKVSSNNQPKTSDTVNFPKVLARRNGDIFSEIHMESAKVVECQRQSQESTVPNDNDKRHSDSVFEYLRELQDSDKMMKGVLRANNTSIGRHEKKDFDSQPSTISDNMSDDRVASEDSVDEYSGKTSTISPASMEVTQSSQSIPDHTPTVFRVDVKETYQFAFVMDNDPSSMAIPECADSFEASYQIQATLDKSGAMDIPVNFEPQLFLPENRSSFDEFLRDAIDSFLHEVQCQINKTRQLLYISDQLACYEEAIALRRRAFNMMSAILPDLTFQSRFDCTSPHLERFLDYVEEILNDDSSIDKSSNHSSEGSIKDCFVDMCDDPVACLTKLRSKILRVIRLLLPQLKLPDTFDIDKDLSDLMKSIIQCAR